MLVVHVVNPININQSIDIIHPARLGRKVVLTSEGLFIIGIEIGIYTIFARVITSLPIRNTYAGK